jgi:hypothetical protein
MPELALDKLSEIEMRGLWAGCLLAVLVTAWIMYLLWRIGR